MNGSVRSHAVPGRILLIGTVVLATATALLSGCATAAAPAKPVAASAGVSSSATMGMSASGNDAMEMPTDSADQSVQVCAVCAGKGDTPAKTGTAVVKDGAQVVSVAIKDGYYTPNLFTVKAGMPTQVVVTGKAKGCVAKPTFASLGKSGDLTAMGSTTIDLGSLAAGTYSFGCSMDDTDGTITVE
jgi:hypothetical protein